LKGRVVRRVTNLCLKELQNARLVTLASFFLHQELCLWTDRKRIPKASATSSARGWILSLVAAFSTPFAITNSEFEIS